MSDVRNILVVGGGVGGMCAGICLAKAGFAVTLIDIDPHWRALGAGVTLNGGALRAFKTVGVLDAIKAEGATGGQASMLKSDGEVIFAAPPGSPFGPDVPAVGGIMRPFLHHILQDATKAAGVDVRLGVGLKDFSQDDEGVTVNLTDGSSPRYDLVLGADGIQSTVRKQLFPDAPAPKFTGQGCWRAVVPRPAAVVGPRIYFGSQKCGINPVSDTEMYLFLLHNIGHNRWLPEEEWVDMLKAEMAEFTDPVLREITDGMTDSSQINYRPLEALILPAPWYKGRVLLIGDAAHSTTPHSAYGAGLAVEDGVVLAEILSQDMSLPQAMEAFMQRRFERCRAVVEGSVHQGYLEQTHAPLSEFMETSAAVAAVTRQPI